MPVKIQGVEVERRPLEKLLYFAGLTDGDPPGLLFLDMGPSCPRAVGKGRCGVTADCSAEAVRTHGGGWGVGGSQVRSCSSSLSFKIVT